jgi:HEAT repeat protein
MDQKFDDEIVQSKTQVEKPSLEVTLETLKGVEDGVASPTLYYGLSGLAPSEISRIEPVWETLDSSKRHSLLTELTEASELNFEFDYRELGFFTLDDPDQDVREAAIELLWEDESLELLNRLVDLAQWDESTRVRAAAISALGRFILLGEYDEIPQNESIRIQELVIGVLSNDDEDVDVRRRALEAIANSGHEIVNEAILEAYNSSEQKMKISSVFAMGRTYDKEWQDIVLREINSDDPEMRYEAARSAGELEISESIPYLGRLAVDDEREVKEVAIWSLGEIAGREALRILSALAEDAEEAEDESLVEAIEDAIGSASLVGDELRFDDSDD